MEASTDPSQKYMVSPPAPVTAQDLQASTTDASEDLTPSTTAPLTPVTTPDSDHHATPSSAAGRDLYYASKRGDLGRVKWILAADLVNINYRKFSWTPVMAAAVKGHSDVVEFLACHGGDLETVKLILDLDVVDVNARTNQGQTAADYTRRKGRQRVLDLLVSRGAH
ncbi:putative ankyrin repeat protein RF_0381 [Haliotis asinina]|uniref:putative ankyrin repeat protein RF_0381 n=1 Tax=Haliotis asinina TaxID=109174 RepID=UPI003531F269